MAEDTAITWNSATPMPSYQKRLKDPDWERKQRLREFRVAARREKRLRKSDAKKQRKLNATILRRMTRNPDKYNKNASRNRIRDCEAERKKIREAAMQQVRELAYKHDPSGEMFNIGPVAMTSDGKVRAADAAKRWTYNQAKKNGEIKKREDREDEDEAHERGEPEKKQPKLAHGVNPERAAAKGFADKAKKVKEPPKVHGLMTAPKPTLPNGVIIPEDQEDWLSLWDITDAEIGARLERAKRKKAKARKDLRNAQKAGKPERRLARDEKRKTYRELKETWKVIKATEKKHKTAVKAVEDREGRVIAVKIANHDRQHAMAICEALGCTIENTPGTDQIQPRLLGMKGQRVDFNDLEFGQNYMDIRLKSQKDRVKPAVKSNRVDLSAVHGAATEFIPTGGGEDEVAGGGDFIQLNVGEGQEYQSLNLNHRLRKKIRKAVDRVQLQKELLVRGRVRFLLKEMGVKSIPELGTYGKPKHIRGNRLLENGTLETDKKARIRKRVDLAEFNKNARVLRKQAKQIAMERGIRKYLEATKRIDIDPKYWETWSHGVGWKEPDVIDPRNIVRPQDLAEARRDDAQANLEMDDDMYSWDGEAEDVMDEP